MSEKFPYNVFFKNEYTILFQDEGVIIGDVTFSPGTGQRFLGELEGGEYRKPRKRMEKIEVQRMLCDMQFLKAKISPDVLAFFPTEG